MDYDWLQLTSKEWLKGDIKAMYNKSLEFDSDKLKLLTIDWEDVRVLRGHNISSVNIEGHGTVKGVLEVTGDNVQVRNPMGTLNFERSRLVSFAPGGEREKDLWSAKFSLGLDIQSGNTNQIDYSAVVAIKRRASATRLLFDYAGKLSKTSGGANDTLIATVNNHRVSSSFDYYKTRYFFFNIVFVELFRDPFLNTDLRSTVGTGLGYTFIDDGVTELTVSGGPSYVRNRFVSVETNKESGEGSAALAIRSHYETELTARVDFIAKYNVQYGSQASGGYTHNMVFTLETEITKDLDIDLSLTWDRISKPTTGEDGLTPESDDYSTVLAVGYSF